MSSRDSDSAPMTPCGWAIDKPIIDGWLAECGRLIASGDDFQTFRMAGNYPYIRTVTACDPASQADQFLTQASRLCEVSSLAAACLRADAIGSPECVLTHGVKVSGTTARFVFQLAVMQRLFGRLDGLRIAEIGGGYGGMACLLLSRYPVAYTCYDLPVVGNMQRRFLTLSGVDTSAACWPVDVLPRQCDLVVSFCAFGELDEKTRKRYAETILRSSRAGCIQVSEGMMEPDEMKSFLRVATGRNVHSVSERTDSGDFPRSGRFFVYWDDSEDMQDG